MPPARVMTGGNRVADAALDLHPEDKCVQRNGAGQVALLRQRQHRRQDRGCWVDDRAQMRVVIVQQISADGVDEGGTQDIQAFRAPDDSDPVGAGQRQQRAHRHFHRFGTSHAQGAADGVE